MALNMVGGGGFNRGIPPGMNGSKNTSDKVNRKLERPLTKNENSTLVQGKSKGRRDEGSASGRGFHQRKNAGRLCNPMCEKDIPETFRRGGVDAYVMVRLSD